MSTLKRTPLFEAHKEGGARLVPFAGWEMPVSYSGVMDEHLTVRKSAGLFDVSHMGEILIRGEEAERCLNFLLTNDVSRLTDKKALYTVSCYKDGGSVDDLIVYKVSKSEYLLCVNASNVEKDFEWFKENSRNFNVAITNESDNFAQIALQGPKSDEILQPLTNIDLASLTSFYFNYGKIGSCEAMIARTGYTGERGVELYLAPKDAIYVWHLLLEKGGALGIKPIGLGARDTLRLEMAYPLYGHELSKTISPIEANLGWVVKLKKGSFIGSDTLREQVEKGTKRGLIGLEMIEKGIPREGYPILDSNGKKIGAVTSGTFSPSLNIGIALALVDSRFKDVGTEISVEIRGKSAKARVVQTPFYKPN
ncbi:MAG: glycine cleavage system protein T [Deltaproteobacteria bacterium RIFCSPHIGHO2_12_FULL_43_9]|nr:MAG: glycine cleavage system protein T [Deltaproteobacteria bacterium RIFCSPHIGHO2_12_FULL_43_9]